LGSEDFILSTDDGCDNFYSFHCIYGKWMSKLAVQNW
jgi:hypothetical protein